MCPILCGVSAYLVAWVVAALVAIPTGVFNARRHGFPMGAAAVAVATRAAVLLLGSKAAYVLEALVFPNDDYVPEAARGWLHGFRIPGGVAVLALAGPAICRFYGLSWRTFGDVSICAIPLAIVCVRIGCFLNSPLKKSALAR
jgi:prolipoprotein diacylglyceryltransferase